MQTQIPSCLTSIAAPLSAGEVTAALIATPSLAKRIEPAHLLAGGLAMSAIGFLGLAFGISFCGALIASIEFSVDFMPVMELATEIIVASTPRERAGAASALFETASGRGGVLGVAVPGSLSAFIYRSKMTGAALSGLPLETARKAGATLGGAAGVVCAAFVILMTLRNVQVGESRK